MCISGEGSHRGNLKEVNMDCLEQSERQSGIKETSGVI